MKVSSHRLLQLIAGCLVVFLAVPFADAADALSQQTTPAQTTSAPQAQPPSPDSGSTNPGTDAAAPPDSPGAVRAQQATSPQSPNQQTSSPQSPNSQTAPQQQPAPQQPSNEPLGTAAAPYEKTTGVAASRPAGAAIAPAKQKRSRSFVIKVSLLVGAAIAVGTVVGLSKGSPSRPNQ